VSLSKPFSDFLKLKSDFTKFCYFLILANVFLGMGMPKAMCRLIPQEVRWDTDVGMSNSRILIKSPCLILTKNLLFFLFANVFLGIGIPKALCRLIPQEGGRNTDVDMSNSRILIKSPLADFF
jgi:hypothetical protein